MKEEERNVLIVVEDFDQGFELAGLEERMLFMMKFVITFLSVQTVVFPSLALSESAKEEIHHQ